MSVKTESSTAVIKLGGSLMGDEALSPWLEAIALQAKKNRIIIVPGGGKFADGVRQLQKRYGFQDHIAHRMALLAMCQYGYFLKGLKPSLKLIFDHEQLPEGKQEKNSLSLWLPLNLPDNTGGIGSNWDYTSDSIALWLAIKLKAEQLIFVKSALPDSRSTSRELSAQGYLDKGFQALIGQYQGRVLYMDKAHFQRLSGVI